MVFNPALITVSALFFLCWTSGLYFVVWIGVSLFLNASPLKRSHDAAKRLLLAALLLPPLAAAIPTISGATLRHSHLSPQLEHHSALCRTVFTDVLSATKGSAQNFTVRVLGEGLNVSAWMLIAAGLYLVVRLIFATTRLEQGMVPYLMSPSERLEASLSKMKALIGENRHRFFECPIPAGYSSVFGLRNTRCVLSQELVVASTDEELTAIIAHEASHLRSKDLEAAFLIGIVDSLFFYLRPVRLLARRWREETEFACDAAAAQATSRPLTVASAILRAARSRDSVPSSHFLPAVSLAFADEAAMTVLRVERLIAQARHASQFSPQETRIKIWGGWLASSVLTVIGFAMLLSPQAVCTAHCSLEAVAHLLR